MRDYRALLPTASAFADAWDELARQAFVGGGAGPLDAASGNAGAGRGAGAKLQRDMTAQLEQGRRDELHRDMMRLPRVDERRVAWLAVDRLSSQWVSSHPTHRVELNAAEFCETFTTYMGCESRLVRPYAGRSIPCGARRNTVCDAYGHQVGLAALPGAPFTDCHDAIAHELWRILMEAGVHVDVEPRGIFTMLIPTQVLLQPGPTPGAVPDAAIDVAMAAPATARNATAGSRLPIERGPRGPSRQPRPPRFVRRVGELSIQRDNLGQLALNTLSRPVPRLENSTGRGTAHSRAHR